MNIRYSIGQLLEYLWQVPGHAAAWRALAAAQVRSIAVSLPLRVHTLTLWQKQSGGFYLRFVNMLINDAIYQARHGCSVTVRASRLLTPSMHPNPHSQLDESLKLLPAVREIEAQQADGRWAALPHQERSERGRQASALQVRGCSSTRGKHMSFLLTRTLSRRPAVIPHAGDGAHPHDALHVRGGGVRGALPAARDD